MTDPLFPPQIHQNLYHSHFYANEPILEKLVEKIGRILTEEGIPYSFNNIYVNFEMHIEGKTTDYRFEIYSNTGPYATPDHPEPFVIVKVIYGNDRDLDDYRLMNRLESLIQHE